MGEEEKETRKVKDAMLLDQTYPLGITQETLNLGELYSNTKLRRIKLYYSI